MLDVSMVRAARWLTAVLIPTRATLLPGALGTVFPPRAPSFVVLRKSRSLGLGDHHGAACWLMGRFSSV